MENYKNPITTKENINELHHILVQTCLDYMVEHGLTDIDEIDFTADGLSSSYKYKEWTPGTDSSLTVIGLETKKIFNVKRNKEYEMPVRKLIGESM
jgi:hypothetical protein